jgi:hypothetical protein
VISGLRLTQGAVAASLCALLILGMFSALPLEGKPLDVLDRPVRVRVTAIPIYFDRDDPSETRFGKLVFRGGLNLFGRSRHFGGFSGMAIDASGTQILAITDAGAWMRATLDYDGRWLKTVGDVTMGAVLGHDGKPLRTEAERDAEGLALAAGDTESGTALVSFEREQRILRYPFTRTRFGPPTGVVHLSKEVASMGNLGLEGVALIRTGRLQGTAVVFPERLKDANGNLRGWLIGGPSPGAIRIRRLGGFDITDATALPDGGIVLLERRFRYSEGVKMRIRRIAPADLRPGRLIEGEVLLEATNRLNIDNMEAIAVHRSRTGETILTVMSDDNFSPFQRSLLMQFAMP